MFTKFFGQLHFHNLHICMNIVFILFFHVVSSVLMNIIDNVIRKQIHKLACNFKGTSRRQLVILIMKRCWNYDLKNFMLAIFI